MTGRAGGWVFCPGWVVLLGVTDVIDEGAPEGTYPEVPLVTVEEWEAIEAYYLAAAPEALPVAGRVEGRWPRGMV